VADFTVEVTSTALESARAFTGEERREVARYIDLIAIDPWIDNQVKIPLLWPPAVFVVYRGTRLWIVYHQTNNLIRVMNVGRWKDPPSPR
jgi:hypothetical protein